VLQYLYAGAELKQLLKLLGYIEDLTGHTPASVGKSEGLAAIVNIEEENGASYCKALRGKPLLGSCTAHI
jgi:hypothetical protein